MKNAAAALWLYQRSELVQTQAMKLSLTGEFYCEDVRSERGSIKVLRLHWYVTHLQLNRFEPIMTEVHPGSYIANSLVSLPFKGLGNATTRMILHAPLRLSLSLFSCLQVQSNSFENLFCPSSRKLSFRNISQSTTIKPQLNLHLIKLSFSPGMTTILHNNGNN